jgi:hypothetical protein
MQEIKPRDMSLPDRMGVAERRLQKLAKKVEWQDDRQDELLEQMGAYLQTVMDFLDGASHRGFTFKKEKLDIQAIKEKEEEKAKDFLEEAAFELEGGM